MASIVSFLLYKPGDVLTFFVLGLILLYIAALLTLWSMVMYIRAAWPDLKNNE
jgi:phosphatidylglycerophosphate synthase